MGLPIAHVIDKHAAHARHQLRHRSVRQNGGIQASEHSTMRAMVAISWLELTAKKDWAGDPASPPIPSDSVLKLGRQIAVDLKPDADFK